MPAMRIPLLVLMLCLLAGGCTRYEYNLLQPAEWSRHIGTTPESIDDPPLVYYLQTFDNRLVLRIQNRSDEPVKLLGEESWIVTPDGESRPLLPQSIAPAAYIKLILPPITPRYERTGPSIGIGIGASSGGRIGTGVGVGTTLGRDTVYIADADATWDWPAQATARLRLAFETPDGQRLTREFIFERQKM